MMKKREREREGERKRERRKYAQNVNTVCEQFMVTLMRGAEHTDT